MNNFALDLETITSMQLDSVTGGFDFGRALNAAVDGGGKGAVLGTVAGAAIGTFTGPGIVATAGTGAVVGTVAGAGLGAAKDAWDQAHGR